MVRDVNRTIGKEVGPWPDRLLQPCIVILYIKENSL